MSDVVELLEPKLTKKLIILTIFDKNRQKHGRSLVGLDKGYT